MSNTSLRAQHSANGDIVECIEALRLAEKLMHKVKLQYSDVGCYGILADLHKAEIALAAKYRLTIENQDSDLGAIQGPELPPASTTVTIAASSNITGPAITGPITTSSNIAGPAIIGPTIATNPAITDPPAVGKLTMSDVDLNCKTYMFTTKPPAKPRTIGIEIYLSLTGKTIYLKYRDAIGDYETDSDPAKPIYEIYNTEIAQIGPNIYIIGTNTLVMDGKNIISVVRDGQIYT